MKVVTTLAAAALVAASATVALAQAGGSSGSGGSSASGGDPATPRQNMTRPTPNSPAVSRRSDEMAPMQQSNVSGRTVIKKKRSMDRTYR
jgi:hypothetical protein